MTKVFGFLSFRQNLVFDWGLDQVQVSFEVMVVCFRKDLGFSAFIDLVQNVCVSNYGGRNCFTRFSGLSFTVTFSTLWLAMAKHMNLPYV